jgi:glutamate dehydrogenase
MTDYDRVQLYINAGVKYVVSFFPKESYEEAFKELNAYLKDVPLHQEQFANLYALLVDELLSTERIAGLIKGYPMLAIKFFEEFKKIALGEIEPTFNKGLANIIEETCPKAQDQMILKTFLSFNESILLTNYFKRDSDEAIAFRLDPRVVLRNRPSHIYPETPYGIYLIQGRDFSGFHVRMRDVARGGLRLLMPRSQFVYETNEKTHFDENYNLALTQQRKNKDIPEGGAKGVILPKLGSDGRKCFTQYIDALLDCMLPEQCGMYAGHMKGKSERLYFGPDENTADFMDWAAEHAKKRGYELWKALTTGKSVKLGGVPHDVHGMTTASVHKVVVELLKKLEIDESTITKCQTGGPDGDLGSNEILVSRDKTVAIVDGSGVLYDRAGLNRTELVRLANKRAPVKEFNRALLRDGFLVTIDETNVCLPDGSKWETGAKLRDGFHLTDYFTADLFVPCGGRPKAVTLDNVSKLFGHGGKPKFRFVVEGANLFFTDPAREVLEKGGVHVFKDATTNKGGVTSSSLEVFAGLALTDSVHTGLMTYNPENAEKPPWFYTAYVQQILEIIVENAKLEFHAIWAANVEKGIPKVEATARLSLEITEMQDIMCANIDGMSEKEKSDLMRIVLPCALPEVIVKHVGINALLRRVPQNYIWALVGAFIGSRYVYQHGIGASKVSFFFFMRELQARAKLKPIFDKLLVIARATIASRPAPPSGAVPSKRPSFSLSRPEQLRLEVDRSREAMPQGTLIREDESADQLSPLSPRGQASASLNSVGNFNSRKKREIRMSTGGVLVQ